MTITYDDGTKRKLKGSDLYALKRYVSSLITQENLRAMAADTTYDWVAHGKAMDQWNAIRLEKKKRAADGRRKGADATKKKYARPGLDNLLRAFIARKERPPVKALASEYGVTDQTIYNAMKRIKTKK
jgi:hypothetical protein